MTEEPDLPPGWEWATIPEVAEINPRTGFEAVEDDQVVSFVPMAAVPEETGQIDLLIQRSFSEVSKGYTRFVDNDVIFAKITPCMENGKIAVARGLVNGLACGSTEFHVVRPAAGIASDYVRYFLVQRSFRRDAERQMQGAVGQKRVPASYLHSSILPIPPAAEQRRIVEKIDELFSLIEAGEQALARARKLLERYRQSVLNAAVTGELTKDWRERHRGEIESGEDLLKRILKARREAWEKAELAKLQARGKPPTDTRWKQKYKEPQPPDTSTLPELPDGWVWASLDQIAWHSGYGTSEKCLVLPNGPLVLRIPNVRASTLVLDDLKYAQNDLGLEPADIVAPGDMLIIRTNGSLDLIGHAVIVDYDLNSPAYFASYLIRFRIVPISCIWEWIMIAWRSERTRSLIVQKAAASAGQYNISQSKLAKIPIPLPSFEELAYGSDLVETLMGVTAHAQVDSAQQFQRIGNLRQAILAAAFSGKLVPQDPADEPASELLARIRAERAHAAAKPTKRPGAGRRRRERSPQLSLSIEESGR